MNLFELAPQDIFVLTSPWSAIHSSSHNLHLDLFIRTYTSLLQTLLHSLLYLRLYQNVHLIFASTSDPLLSNVRVVYKISYSRDRLQIFRGRLLTLHAVLKIFQNFWSRKTTHLYHIFPIFFYVCDKWISKVESVSFIGFVFLQF